MNGDGFLLDTNVVLGLLKARPEALTLFERAGRPQPSRCAVSVITRMELLGFPGITADEEAVITGFLDCVARLPITEPVEDAAITLRRTRRLKLPDAIVAATARVHGLELLTLDDVLAARWH